MGRQLSYSTGSSDEFAEVQNLLVLTPRLPVQLTSFIGRERAMQEIVRLFGNARLVTLSGAGGCGKTRLALQVVPRLTGALSCAVAWVDLAGLSDSTLIPQSIARALGIFDVSDHPLLDVVVNSLRVRRLLIVLDNGEHIIDAVARVAERILTACPDVFLLVTSREALNIAGETAWMVPPLTVPSSTDDLADLQECEAVRLFLDRAQAAQPSFVLTAETAPSVIEICRRLDGMPLAIELAASRLHLLGVAEIAERLERCFSVLTAGRRTALPRHQTLQATIDWSYDLLSAAERRLFDRLAVFAGGFTLEAVESVCSDDSLPSFEILNLLGHLADKSLVVVEQRGMAMRYRLLETIRQYAHEKLRQSGLESVFRERHCQWCVHLAESGLEMETSGQAALVDRFEVEHDNFRTAMQWALDAGDGPGLARLASALWRFWLMRGYLREGARWLTDAAACLPEHDPERINPLLGAAVLICHQADYVRSTELFAEARAICRVNGDRNAEGEVLYGLATLAQYQGRYAEAAEHFEESMPLFDHTRGRALSLMGLAVTLLYLGDVDRADKLCQQSLVLCREVGDERSLAAALTSLGIIALAQGDQARAEEVCGESLTLRRDVGDRGGVAHTLTVLGGISLERGDGAVAARRYREALSLRHEMGDAGGTPAPLEGLAAVATVRGDAKRAAFLFGAADGFRLRHDTPSTPVEHAFRERYLAMSRGLLTESVFAEAWDAGNLADPITVVQSALSEDAVEPAGDPITSPIEKAENSVPAALTALDIQTLGVTRICRGDHEVAPGEWTYSKARELLLYLLCAGPSTKEQIGLALWPDASEMQLRSAFHTTLHHLRRALGDPNWIVFHNGRYGFNRSLPFTYDAGQFEQEISRSRHFVSTNRAAAIDLLSQAVERYRGRYLGDLPDAEWLLPKQNELERIYLDALLLLGELLTADHQYASAATTFRRAIGVDPLLESAHRGLMQCYALQGERGQALRHYQQLAELLRIELSAEPDSRTRELFEHLRLKSPHQ